MERVTSLIHETAFKYPDRWLLRARLHLYEDRLELTGWCWRGRHHRIIKLNDITRIKWWSGIDYDVNLALRLKSGERLPLWVKGPGLWKFKLEEHAPHLKDKNPPLPMSQKKETWTSAA